MSPSIPTPPSSRRSATAGASGARGPRSGTQRDDILAGRTSLGIELGSTRIKACLIGSDATGVLATGAFS